MFRKGIFGGAGQGGAEAAIHPATTTVTLEMLPSGPPVATSRLDVQAKVTGTDAGKVLEIANAAKAACSIFSLLNAKVTMDAKVE